MGIKVLSLFFIDEVGKYRTAQGEKGIYATMFEECYEELMALPKFADLKSRFSSRDNIHDGYFSQDKKKNTRGDTQADYDIESEQALVDEIVEDKLLMDMLFEALAELTDDERSPVLSRKIRA